MADLHPYFTPAFSQHLLVHPHMAYSLAVRPFFSIPAIWQLTSLGSAVTGTSKIDDERSDDEGSDDEQSAKKKKIKRS